jgi:hypothetical protein
MKAQVAEGHLLATVYARTLRRAAELLGSEEELALRLNVTPSHLALWIKDVAATPADVFLRAVDIIAELEGPTYTPKGEDPFAAPTPSRAPRTA